MSDLEITKLCAATMGVDFSKGFGTITCKECGEIGIPYDPLHDDAQAMALFRSFRLWEWIRDGSLNIGSEADLNRAICETVAKMVGAKP